MDDLQTTTLRDLIARFQAGKNSALDALIRRTEERLAQFARRMLREFPGVWAREQTEDDTATALLMDRFYRNLLGKRADGAKPMGKAAALREAKNWLRGVTASEALERLGALTQGVVRGERPAREEMQAVPKPKDASKDYKPYAHPRYWAAFILIGDPE